MTKTSFYGTMVYYTKGERNTMRETKRFVMILLMAATVLGGCGSRKSTQAQTESEVQKSGKTEGVKEYLYSDLVEIKDKFWNLWLEETGKLSEAEYYGISNDEEEQTEHYLKVSADCTNKIAENNKDIPIGQRVIVTGYIDEIMEMNKDSRFSRKGMGNIIFCLKHNSEDNGYGGFMCRTNDETILELENNTPAKIEGVFLQPDMVASNSDIYDCKIIEHGEPEEVETEPLMTAAPIFD